MLDSPRFIGAAGRGIPEWLKIDYIGKRNIWFAISGAVVVLSFGALAVNGLNLGIDFEGGSQMSFSTAQPVAIEKVRSAGGQGRPGDGENPGTRCERRRQVLAVPDPDGQLTTEETGAFQRALEKGVQAEAFGVKNVSASFGRQIAEVGDPRDHRLAASDRRVHLDALPLEVRGTGDRLPRRTTC